MKVDGKDVRGDLNSVFDFGKIVNKKAGEVGSLKVKKTFEGLPDGVDVSRLTFKITGPDVTETVTYAEFDENGEYVIGTELPAEAEYTVEETNAGTLLNGYILTGDSITEGSGTVVKNEMTTISLENEYKETLIKISKRDNDGQEELPGAHIQIFATDEEGAATGEPVAEWTSTSNVHQVKGLYVGVKYILRETTAPDGYAVPENASSRRCGPPDSR